MVDLAREAGGYEPVDPSVKVNQGQWHRIILSFDLAAGKYDKYIDGVYHSSQANAGLDGRQSIGQTFWLLNDNDGENGEVYLNSLAIYDRSLTADEARALGRSSGSGIPRVIP
ncbi:MAG: LamG domain-containing protein, partial [Verrucomicrobia bacterium]|nr:LamG domain-containing protein [Verrucomicrobiota bacterium]